MFKYTIPKLRLLSEKPSHGRDCPAGSGDCNPSGSHAAFGICTPTGGSAISCSATGNSATEGCVTGEGF